MSIPALVFFACALMAGQCALAQMIVVPIGGDPNEGTNEPTQTENGYCGDPTVNLGEDVSYSYDPETNTLTISGAGAMMDYQENDERPWNEYRNSITTIVIGSGVTSIGDIAFGECKNLLSVTIPSSVTEIGDYALAYCDNLNSVTIQGETQLTNIKEGAFSGCRSLSSFTIPASVTTIGGYAFAYCTILTGFEIPAGVTSIGPAAFSGCPEVSSITLAQGNVNFLVDDGILFNNDGTRLICYPAGKSGATYTVPAGVRIIDDGALADNENLTSVTFENNSQLTTIGNEAFAGDINLESITIPEKVTGIGEFAFGACFKLVTVTFDDASALDSIGMMAFEMTPWYDNISDEIFILGSILYKVDDSYTGPLNISNGIKVICHGAFEGCTNLTAVTIPESVTTIGDDAFWGCSSLTSVTFTGNSQLTTIGYSAFGHSGITSITIPANVTDIGESAFEACLDLTAVTFDGVSHLTHINESLFNSCSSLMEITIPSSVTSIGLYAFYSCELMTTVTFDGESQLNYIGTNAFSECRSLSAIEIPSSVTCIGDFAFSQCDLLETVTFAPNSHLTVIDENAFYECGVLSSITIPAGVTKIGDGAFTDCVNLATVSFADNSQLTNIGACAFLNAAFSSITIPASVDTIGDFAFESCANLTTVTFGEHSPLTYLARGVFYDCEDLETIVIPAAVTGIGENAFHECGNLTTVTFEEHSSLTYLDEGVFYDCQNIETIVIPAGVTSIGGSAFQGCGNLTTVTFEDHSSLTTLGHNVFSGCQKLENIVIPEGVTSIGDCAFSECGSLESIIIPSPVKMIGNYAFENCGNLTSVYVLPSTPPSIYHSFENINNSCHFYLHGEEYEIDNDWQNEVINEFSHTYVYSLALNEGITATGSSEFTAYDRSYYTVNTSITISGGDTEAPVGYQPGSFAGYTKNYVSIPGNTFEMPAQDVRIRAIWTPIEWEGTGAENDPYMIVYPSQMDLLAERVNTGTDYTDTYFKLANDITYSYEGYGPTESNYVGMGMMSIDNNQEINEIHQQVQPTYRGFNGIFDGNGKTISGVRMYSPTDTVTPGIFNVVTNPGVVKNLTVRDTKITAVLGAGGIVGTVKGGSIEKCISYADLFIIKSNSPMTPTGVIGGIAGENIFSGRVYNCTSYSTIKIEDNTQLCIYVGGVVGAHAKNSVTDNCYSYASIVVGDNASLVMGLGGITGTIQEDCSITNCFSSATILFGGNLLTCREFSGIVGSADDGVISGNIVVDAVIPDLDGAGVILGGTSNEVNLSYNYYSNCSVGLNIDNIGGNGGDIAANDGAVKATILLENEAAPASLADGEKVVFRREFKQGVSSTVCLPVAIDESLASAAGKFFTFAGVDTTDPDDWAVVMQEVPDDNMVDGDLLGNTPYLFIPDADGPVLFIGEADGSDVDAGFTTNGNWSFNGTYESIEWNAGNQDLGKVYGFAAEKYEAPDNNGDSNPDYTINPGKFVMAGAGASIAPYRAYLKYSAPQLAPSRSGSRESQPLPGSMRVVLLNRSGDETAVGKINTETGAVSIDTWYDMSGRQIEGAPVKGGMYIHGGKTIMINE